MNDVQYKLIQSLNTLIKHLPKKYQSYARGLRSRLRDAVENGDEQVLDQLKIELEARAKEFVKAGIGDFTDMLLGIGSLLFKAGFVGLIG